MAHLRRRCAPYLHSLKQQQHRYTPVSLGQPGSPSHEKHEFVILFFWLQVRRKASPAQGFVKDWVGKWRDDVAVRGSDSHREITGKHATHYIVSQSAHSPMAHLAQFLKVQWVVHHVKT